MPAGCMNIAAVNYDPAATEENYSCIYLLKLGATCYAFQDVPPSDFKDQSFTLSYAIEGDNYVFFHDYVPDFYFHTREKLHTVKNSKIYTHNAGPRGQYYEPGPKSFFIDVVFRSEDEMTLNAVNWVTEVLDKTSGLEEEFKTLTHITVWNAHQCTGRIPTDTAFQSLEGTNTRKTKALWNFNDFRDIVKERGAAPVVKGLFENFAVNTDALDPDLPWYEKDLIEDQYFIVRFEFDNIQDKIVFLHGVDVDVSASTR